MAKTAPDAALAGTLEQTTTPPPSAADLKATVRAFMEGLSGDVTLTDFQIYHELQKLADYIQTAKREIAELRPDDIREHHIPMATDELDAIVEATAEATGSILDAAESIEKIADGMSGDLGDEVRGIVTRIYEASNFQDVTGQRITKVVRTLKHIERTIDGLLAVFGDEITKSARPNPADVTPSDDEKRLLQGPQLPAEANKQDDIDAIFAEL